MKKYSDYKNSSVPWIGEIPTTWNLSQLRYVIECLDGKRVPVELSLRADMQGNIPYWGAGNIVDYVDKALFDEELVLLGEDGAPFFDHTRPVAFHITEPISMQQDTLLRDTFRELRECGYVHIQWADNIPYYLSLTVDGQNYFTNKKDAKKAERKLSRREWRIAVISAIIGGMVGLIPWICTLIGGGQ